MNIKGKVCLVTGSARRIGRSIALDLAGRGANLAIHYGSSKAAAQATAEECRKAHADNRAEIFHADLADSQSVASLAKRVLIAFGCVDILINNAAVFLKTPLLGDHDERWEQIVAVNLEAPCILANALAPAMQAHGQGLIINITDALLDPPRKHYAAYNISKASLEARTREMALRFAPQVRVNAIAPGVALLPDDSPPDLVAKLTADIPLQRIGQAADIAAACRFYIESDYVTGATLAVDGGASITGYCDFES